MGNLYSTTLEEIKKTAECVYALIRQRQVDVDFRKRSEIVVQKYKNELMIINKKYELLQRENDQLKRSLGKAENDLLAIKQRVIAHTENQKNTKDNYKQNINKLEQRVAKITHDLRKTTASFGKLQESYRKVTKDTFPYKNNFDETNRVENEGLDLMYKHLGKCEMPAIHAFALMLRDGYETTQQKLISDNAQLKECLKLIQDEYVTMLNNAIIRVKLKLPGKDIKCLEPIHLKPIIFQTSIAAVLNDIYQIVKENLCRMKDALDVVLNLSN